MIIEKMISKEFKSRRDDITLCHSVGVSCEAHPSFYNNFIPSGFFKGYEHLCTRPTMAICIQQPATSIQQLRCAFIFLYAFFKHYMKYDACVY